MTLDLTAFAKPERHTVSVTTKVTPTEAALIGEAVEIMRAAGAEDVSVSSFARVATVAAAQAVRAERAH